MKLVHPASTNASLAASLLALVAACAAPGKAPAADLLSLPVVAAELVAADPRGVVAWDGRTGARVEWSELVARAAAAEAVLVGENHGHPLGLASAAALFEDLVAARPRATLAMEFFERDEQSRIDDWLAGLADEPVFLARTQRSAGNYPPGHRAMLHAAKSSGRAVLAANAPRAHVRLARTQGYEALAQLTPEQQRLFHFPDKLFAGRYRESFDAFMANGSDPASAELRPRLDAVYRSQSLWDWTMGASVVEAVRGARTPVLLVVGRFHVDHEGGTLQVVRHLRPGTRTLVVSFVDQRHDALQEADRGRGDIVVYVGPGS